ncbi:MFS general substrate transporter [Coniophora puteana RWD-64-598 SS2]|uniref:MFS general substrate transporter n=1 Tax=Coniophora puteana (strain RWD-64-598) TaxID=741705 RepID=R7SHP2_CONPW|nr:MFS general substrate transporter [Coniophora puteana RWD-64-598 SS2]EIW74589.1 MFS general substrate transporter [Coniophora puteana RWD-64-598 SS2]
MAPRFIRNLVPQREAKAGSRTLWQALKTVTFVQWLQLFTGWVAWSCDAIDFFSVSLTGTLLDKQFGKDNTQLTTAITLTLLFRSIGAVLFGVMSDRFGRKWPLVINLSLVSVFSLATGFVQTFKQFLAVRALFGVAMGGIWGLAASTALENLPVEVRGLASGLLQEGYAVGYLFAAVVDLYLVPETGNNWRALFWTGSGISAFAAVLRAITPESEVFLRAKAIEKAKGTDTSKKTKIFVHETKEMLKQHWKLCIYAVLLMTGFNFLSHGSQDLYPIYLETSKGIGTRDATIATIIGNCGAIVGGAFAGWGSQYIGRRLTIVICCVLVGAFIPLWILPSGFSALAAGAFCIQIGVQGAWGVIPIFLAEISPPAFRATFPGVAYQLGNMVSSASSQIEARGGDNFTLSNGQPNYAPVQGIFIGVVTAFVLLITIVGPEKHAARFEKHKTAFEEGGADDDAVLEDEYASGSASDPERRPTEVEEVHEKRSQESLST